RSLGLGAMPEVFPTGETRTRDRGRSSGGGHEPEGLAAREAQGLGGGQTALEGAVRPAQLAPGTAAARVALEVELAADGQRPLSPLPRQVDLVENLRRRSDWEVDRGAVGAGHHRYLSLQEEHAAPT